MSRGVRIGRIASAVLFACAAGPGALAAGGHHGVDDATLMDAGTCEAESWVTRSQDQARLLHAGLGCRAGPVELAAAGEVTRLAGVSQTGWQMQLKWAAPLSQDFAAGVSVTPSWQAHVQPRYQGTVVAALATWKASESLLVHMNLGRDFLQGAASQPRSGAALEWSPRERLSVVGELYLEDRGRFIRVGPRWLASERLSFDISRAQRLSGPGASNWTVGATRRFDLR